MNVIKHMEAAFVVALSVAGLAAVAVDAIPDAQARVPAPAVAAAIQPGIPVVHVTAKRLSPVQKLQALALERFGKRA